jgi:ferredoxin
MISKKIVLKFPKDTWEHPIVCRLSKDFDLTFNILKAEITPREEGVVVMELSGSRTEYRKGLEFLKEQGVLVEPLAQDVTRRDDVCIQCGACIAVCPTKALHVRRETQEVLFDPGKCIGCQLCIPACPPRAMEIRL